MSETKVLVIVLLYCSSASHVAADEHFHWTKWIWIPAGRYCQVIPGKHGSVRFRMILERHCALSGMSWFVVAMEREAKDYALIVMMTVIGHTAGVIIVVAAVVRWPACLCRWAVQGAQAEAEPELATSLWQLHQDHPRLLRRCKHCCIVLEVITCIVVILMFWHMYNIEYSLFAKFSLNVLLFFYAMIDTHVLYSFRTLMLLVGERKVYAQ